MLAFQTGIQFAQAAISAPGEIKSEIARQQGICDQIKDLKEVQIPKLQDLRSKLAKGQELSDDTKQSLFTLTGTLSATVNSINDIQKDAQTKMYIQIVVSIITIAIVAIYIITKKSV